MMKKLSKDLKRMLSALAHQDAGDFLSMQDKMEVLGVRSEVKGKPLTAVRKVIQKPVNRRIALISDGSALGSPLDYTIDACKRQKANIDLLLHGEFDRAAISEMERQIRAAGLSCQHILLRENVIGKIIEYISNHPSIIFLVGMQSDPTAKVLMEEVVARRGRHMLVPLVLIDEKKYPEVQEQTAA